MRQRIDWQIFFFNRYFETTNRTLKYSVSDFNIYNMRVLKFGGTSVGSVKSILSLKQIVEKAKEREKIIVVVSALGGITDKLINTSTQASSGDSSYITSFDEIVSRHHEMVHTIITDHGRQVALLHVVDELLNELKDIYQGIFLIRDLSPKTLAAIVSYGERISSRIAAELTGAKWFDSREFIKTEKKQGKHILD